jgi:hypothetical protein
MKLPAHLREIERKIAEDLNDDPLLKPGDEGYVELREALIEATETSEELAAVRERYPFWSPEMDAAEEQRRMDQERDAALNAATTEEELHAAMEEHPAVDVALTPSEIEYRKAVAEAETPAQLDEIYARFGRPVPDRSLVQ